MDGRMIHIDQIPGYTNFDRRYVVMCDSEEIINLDTARVVTGKMLRDKEGISKSISRKRLIAAAKEYRILQRQQQGLKTDEELEQMYAAVRREIQEEGERPRTSLCREEND